MATPEGHATSELQSRIDRVIRVCQGGCSDGLESVLRWEKDVETLLNQTNNEGTTALHEACCHGNQKCVKVLLKYGACANMWDVRGFPPIHTAVYNNHKRNVKLLLDNKVCEVNCTSKYGESPLHIACLRGHLELSEYLVRRQANVLAADGHGNTPLHYAASSNSPTLVNWLLSVGSVKDSINERNKFGQTAAHRAVTLGCPASVSVLLHHGADFSLQDGHGLSALEIGDLLNNTRCIGIAQGTESPLPIPPTPPLTKNGPLSRSDDTLLHGSAPPRPPQPQRSQSNGESAISPSSSSPQPLRRKGSMTGMSRPITLSLPRRDSRTSLHRSLSRHSWKESKEGASIYLTKETADRISTHFEHQDSPSWEEAHQVVYDNTAYEPPPDMMFIPPVERVTLTHDNQKTFSESHNIKLRISKDYWNNRKDDKLDVCLCAAMSLNRSFPVGYTVVSPVVFVSARSRCPCKMSLSLPHAVVFPTAQEKERVVILSTTTVDPNLKATDSPLFSPSERTLAPLPDQGLELQADVRTVTFKTYLVCPSLFVVAIKDNFPRPLPLRCSLFVAYPQLDRGASVAGFDIETYIGMNLMTVTTAMTALTSKLGHHFEEQHFTLSTERLYVTGQLSNHPSDWGIEPRGGGELRYTQVALTQDIDIHDSYSHLPVYPPRERFFIEPITASGAVKCRITVKDSQKDLYSILVVPYAPKKEPTPDRSPPPSNQSSQTQLINGFLISQV